MELNQLFRRMRLMFCDMLYSDNRRTMGSLCLLPLMGEILSSNSVCSVVSLYCVSPFLFLWMRKYQCTPAYYVLLCLVVINGGVRLDSAWFLENVRRDHFQHNTGFLQWFRRKKKKDTTAQTENTLEQLEDQVWDLKQRLSGEIRQNHTLAKNLNQTSADLNRERARLNEYLQRRIRQDPSFTDLNDSTRPEKIIQKFEELRNNPRCDLYDDLDDMGVDEMDQLIVVCEFFMACHETAALWLKDCLSEQLQLLNRVGGTTHQSLQSASVLEIKRELRARANGSELYNMLYKDASSRFQNQYPNLNLSDKRFERFGKMSCEVCWLLVLSATPLEPRVAKRDCSDKPARLDRDWFDIYPDCVGRNLNSVKCTVWPAILSDNDRVQCRGIAYAVYFDFEGAEKSSAVVNQSADSQEEASSEDKNVASNAGVKNTTTENEIPSVESLNSIEASQRRFEADTSCNSDALSFVIAEKGGDTKSELCAINALPKENKNAQTRVNVQSSSNAEVIESSGIDNHDSDCDDDLSSCSDVNLSLANDSPALKAIVDEVLTVGSDSDAGAGIISTCATTD